MEFTHFPLPQPIKPMKYSYFVFGFLLILSACTSTPQKAAVVDNPYVQQILPYGHIDGFGTKTDTAAWIAWEFEAQAFVRYQIAYTSCTCRQESINKRSLLYLEIAKGKNGGKVHKIYFDYWGDSPVMPEGMKREEIESGFVPKFVNIKASTLDSIDTISGATVTTANLKQIVGAVLAYHDKKYSNTAIQEAPDIAPDAVSGATSH